MSSSKHFCLALCFLCAALPVRAEKPKDSRSNDSPQRMDSEIGYTKEIGGKTLDEWRKDLTHGDPSVRTHAVEAIIYFKQAAKVVPDILDRLKDRDASPRARAAISLRYIQSYPTDRTRIIQTLGNTVKNDPQSIVRYEAAKTIRYFFCPFDFTVKAERDVVLDLVKGLRDSSTWEVRDMCAEALIYAGVDPQSGPAPQVTDVLMERANPLYESTTQVRVKAIMALGKMGRPQDPKKLIGVLGILKMPANYKSSHPSVKIWSHVAIIALEEKVNKEDLKTITTYLKRREAAIRAEAVSALGALGDKAQEYVGTICDLLVSEKDNAVLQAGAQALGNMKNTGQRVKSTLITLTEKDSRESIMLVLNACAALMQLGFTDAETMKALDKVLEHKSLGNDEKNMLKKILEDIKKPKKKAPKAAPKEPEKGIANPNNQRKR